MRYILFLFFTLTYSITYAQESDAFIVHPAIGRTIDLEEKIHYKLFNSFSNKDFEYAYLIQNNDSSYVLRVQTTKSGLQEKLLADLRKWTTYHGEGVGGDDGRTREKGVLIIGIPLEEAISLGGKYGQLLILAGGIRGAELKACC